MSDPDAAAGRAANDVGGREAGPFVPTDHVLAPWEKRAHALLDVLARKGVLLVEEKRRGIEELGRDLYDRLSYYETWVLAASRVLIAKGVITSEELARKMAEVVSREAGHGREVCP